MISMNSDSYSEKNKLTLTLISTPTKYLVWFQLRRSQSSKFLDFCLIWKTSAYSNYLVESYTVLSSLFTRNALDRYFAPWSPITFSLRSSVLSVCVKKSLCLLCWIRENSTHPAVLVMYQQDLLLVYLRFDCRRDGVCWVSVWKSRSVSIVLKKRKFDSPCSLVMHQTGILLFDLRFHSLLDRACWVSVWKSRSVCFVFKKGKFDSLCSLVMH